MFTLHCTKKLQKELLGFSLTEAPAPPTTVLGNWYANLVPTSAGWLVVFVNERTLLTVAILASALPEWHAIFLLRVANVFGHLAIPVRLARREALALEHVQFAGTTDRRVLGSMNDIAFQFQNFAARSPNAERLSLSEIEFRLTGMPMKLLGMEGSGDAVRRLFAAQAAKPLLSP